jgi:hypothetical protein
MCAKLTIEIFVLLRNDVQAANKLPVCFWCSKARFRDFKIAFIYRWIVFSAAYTLMKYVQYMQCLILFTETSQSCSRGRGCGGEGGGGPACAVGPLPTQILLGSHAVMTCP